MRILGKRHSKIRNGGPDYNNAAPASLKDTSGPITFANILFNGLGREYNLKDPNNYYPQTTLAIPDDGIIRNQYGINTVASIGDVVFGRNSGLDINLKPGQTYDLNTGRYDDPKLHPSTVREQKARQSLLNVSAGGLNTQSRQQYTSTLDYLDQTGAIGSRRVQDTSKADALLSLSNKTAGQRNAAAAGITTTPRSILGK